MFSSKPRAERGRTENMTFRPVVGETRIIRHRTKKNVVGDYTTGHRHYQMYLSSRRFSGKLIGGPKFIDNEEKEL